jgi:hypothetical protein
MDDNLFKDLEKRGVTVTPPVEVNLTAGKQVTKEEHVKTLIQEGHIVFPHVENVEAIKNNTLLDAYHNVVLEQGKIIKKLFADLQTADDIQKQFYRAAQKANICVYREDGKIALEKVEI